MQKINLYHLVKINNKEKVVLVKYGNFYRTYDNDTIIINYLLNYKINNNIIGFPKESLYKVINKENLSVIIAKDNSILEYKINTNKYSKILNEANIEIELKNKLNNIIKLIENKLRNDINLYNLVFKYVEEL